MLDGRLSYFDRGAEWQDFTFLTGGSRITQLGGFARVALDPRRVGVTNRGAIQVSNRAAIVYEFPWAGLYAKLIYGQSFKPPSPFQLYRNRLTIAGSAFGNPALQPQTAKTVELQLGIRPVSGFHASVTGFSSWVDNVVLFLVEGGNLIGRNADIEVQGMEVSTTYTADEVVSFWLNGSFVPGQFVEAGVGGIDVPGLGSRVYLSISQEL